MRKLWVAAFVLGVMAITRADTYSIPWWTVDGGGGTSTGGGYSLSGTVGQPDAGGPMTGGSYALSGGFWVGAVASTAQPDALIRAPRDSGFVGGDIYGAGQTTTANASVTRPAVITVRVENDGDTPEVVTVTGTGDGGGWTVRYFDAEGQDRTGLFTTQATFPLTAGGDVEARLEVTPDAGVALGAERLFSVTVTCPASGKTDTVSATVRKVADLSAVALAINPPSFGAAQRPITLTATAAGGVHLECRFLGKLTTATTYTVLRDWGGNVYADWQPAPQKYRLYAEVREVGSTTAKASPGLYYTVRAPLTAVQLTGSPASPTSVNRRVTFALTATGGADLQYGFAAEKQVEGGAPIATFSRAYNTNRGTWWTPTEMGTYIITGYAKDLATGEIVTATNTYVVAPPPSAVTLAMVSPLAGPTAVGVPISLLATPVGGGTLEYQFLYNVSPTSKPSATWTKEIYGAGRGYVLTPTQAAFYTFRVYVREKGSTVNFQAASTDLKVQVMPKVSDYGLTCTPSGLTVRLEVTGVVGGAQPTWKFWARKKGTATWGLVRDYAASPIVESWMPGGPGTYQIMVYIKEVGSKAANYDLSKTFEYTAP